MGGGRGDKATGRQGDKAKNTSTGKGERVSEKIRTHRDLEVYGIAFEAAMRIFDISPTFPKEETYALTDQIRRSSRSVCANLAEAWRKRRYEAAFVNKLSDVEAEAAETQSGSNSP
jgi:hypothetical protein